MGENLEGEYITAVENGLGMGMGMGELGEKGYMGVVCGRGRGRGIGDLGEKGDSNRVLGGGRSCLVDTKGLFVNEIEIRIVR